MKRTKLAAALALSIAPMFLVGCDSTTKVEDKKTESGPGGAVTTKSTTEQTKSGDMK